MRTHSIKIINETNVTLTANYDSQQVERIHGYSVQFVWTATAVDATIKLQASNDGTNWDDIAGASCTITNTSDSKLFNLPEVYYRYFRPRVEVITGELLKARVVTNLPSI